MRMNIFEKHKRQKIEDRGNTKSAPKFGLFRINPYFCSRKEIRFMEEKRYEDVELGPMTAAEPVAATLSESVTRSGLLNQVMGLSRTDKVALIRYLKEDTGTEDFFKTDEVGRIMLTKNMREAVVRAERDMEEGKCLSESDFKERFAKWL